MSGAATLSPFVLIRSAGEMASAIACRLYRANIGRLCLVDLAEPLCVRRSVSFCPALEQGSAVVEGVEARRARSAAEIQEQWRQGRIAVMCTDDWRADGGLAPDVVVDAILAKRNLGTRRDEAPLVIGLGPGFTAGEDCHLVVETNRGHDLGRIIDSGHAAPNTGVPGAIAGFAAERVLRAPIGGIFASGRRIGDTVSKGEAIGYVGDQPVTAGLDGVLRGLIRSGTAVGAGLKLGDIDPRGDARYCLSISDKARAIAGSVLEAVVGRFNRPDQSVLPKR